MEHRRARPDQARLRDRTAAPAAGASYGAGGFLHFGQGKWYPGEQLPRWALGCYLARRRRAVWNDPTLFADERRDGQRHARRDAQGASCDALARPAGRDRRTRASAAYEDAWYYLWRERRLPVNVDPFDARLDDELERARLRKRLRAGAGRRSVGYVLPLARGRRPGRAGRRWITGPWFLRDERMYLMPGDSPMGFRLPLDSLPWAARATIALVEADPFAPREPLPLAATLRGQYAAPCAAHPEAASLVCGGRGGHARCRGGRSGGAAGGPAWTPRRARERPHA